MIWLAVSADIYELPMVVRDTANELAQALGITRGALYKRKRMENEGTEPREYAIRTVEDEQV